MPVYENMCTHTRRTHEVGKREGGCGGCKTDGFRFLRCQSKYYKKNKINNFFLLLKKIK